jgi:hypothetical protein
VSERIKLKFVARHTTGDIACGTGACVTFLASVICARSRSPGIVQLPAQIEQSWRYCTGRGYHDLRLSPKFDRIAAEGELMCAQRLADLLRHRELSGRHFADKSEGHMVVLRIYPAASALKVQLTRHLSKLPGDIDIRPECKK